jgi:hypothetical protein
VANTGGGPAAQRVTRDVELSAVPDLLKTPPRATVAHVQDEEVDVLPVRAHCAADVYAFGVRGGSCDFAGREVVLVIDDGSYWFELRGVSVRGIATRIDAPPQAAMGLTWYAIEARRVLAWDYGSIREVS